MSADGRSSSAEPDVGRRRAGIPARLLLGLSALLVALLLAEMLARFHGHLRNLDTLEAALGELSEPSDSPTAGMVNIVRLSTNNRIMYELQPGLRDRTFRGSTVTTDDSGFRVTGGEQSPLDDPVIIVGLGDSVMFGHGIADDETYLSLLQGYLASRYPERDWRVINTAAPGYNTVMEVETLREKCLPLSPDLVILHVVGNDYAPPRFVRKQQDVFALDRVFLWDDLWERVTGRVDHRRRVAYQLGEGWLRSDPENPTDRPEEAEQLFGRQAFLKALDDLSEMSAEHGFELIVFTNNELGRETIMVKDVRERDLKHISLSPDLAAWLKANGGLELDVESYHASELVVGPDNRHPSAVQHQLAARRIARSLEQSGWIQRQLSDSPGPPAER